MRVSPARRLILLYAAMSASVYPFAAFEDNISMGGAQQFVFGLVLWAVILGGLWKGSELAWFVAAILDALMILGLILMQPPTEAWPFVLIGLALGHLIILFSRPVRAHVRTRAGTRLAPS